MSLTVLELAVEAATELSQVTPTAVVANTGDPGAQKLLRHLHRTCRQLAARYDWQVLRREKTFTTTATATQTGALASDLLRFVPETMFNRTKDNRVSGPLSPEEWQAFQAVAYGSVFDQFYIRGNAFLMSPTPAAGDSIAYEYITNYIGTNAAASTERTIFSVDSDVTYFDDELVLLGMVWRYRKAEGLDYSEEFREFETRFYDLTKMDGGRRILDMNDGSVQKARVPVAPRIPDTLVF